MIKFIKIIWKIITGLIFVAAILYVFSMIDGRQNEIIVAILLGLYLLGNIRGAAAAEMILESARANERQFKRMRWMLGDPLFIEEPKDELTDAASKRELTLVASLIPEFTGLLICAWVLFFGKQ